jgi:hypothetical protein
VSARRFAYSLGLLLGLFCLRVLAQLVQWRFDIGFLPPFEAWQSGVLPYWLLVCAQVLIVLVLGRIVLRVASGTMAPSPQKSLYWTVPGCVYLAVMLVRLALGTTWLNGHSWFDKPLPTVFHIVLASFLLVVGAYHRAARPAARGS